MFLKVLIINFKECRIHEMISKNKNQQSNNAHSTNRLIKITFENVIQSFLDLIKILVLVMFPI